VLVNDILLVSNVSIVFISSYLLSVGTDLKTTFFKQPVALGVDEGHIEGKIDFGGGSRQLILEVEKQIKRPFDRSMSSSSKVTSLHG
jgi:hypothetical protein